MRIYLSDSQLTGFYFIFNNVNLSLNHAKIIYILNVQNHIFISSQRFFSLNYNKISTICMTNSLSLRLIRNNKQFMMKKVLLIIVLYISGLSCVFQPGYLPFATSNYAGVNGVQLQPASIAHSRYKFDLTC